MISAAYTYYMSQYGHKAYSKYDIHTKSQLKDTCSKVSKVNSQTPTYKIDISVAAQKYAIDLKEHARELEYIIRDLSDEQSGEMTFKKSAQSSNPDAVEAKFVGDSNSADSIEGLDIEVSQLATHQVNTGNFLQPGTRLLKPGSYSFDLSINNLTYEFEFNVSDDETSSDIQSKLSRLINRSNIGVSSEVTTDGLGNTALTITSDATGIATGIKPTIFNIASDSQEFNDTFGLDRVTNYPSNAVYTINGNMHTSSRNDFIVNKTYEVTLKSVTGGSPVNISLRTDGDSMVESIDELVSGYNNFISVTTDNNNNIFSGNERLRREFTNIALAHRMSLSNSGLKVDNDGSVHVDRDTIIDASDNGTLSNIFSELNDFKKAMQRKAEYIAADPMGYVNNIMIAYKNPIRQTADPYNSSPYVGMMFNGYM